MENVYALVKRFYSAHGRANIFVPRTLIERYLRAAAWRGRSSEDLCRDWYCIEDFLTVIIRRDDMLARLFIRIDYLALFFRYADAHIDRRPLKRHVEDYFARMNDFLTYLDETGDYEVDLGELDADLDMFYITGRFRLPERVAWEEVEGLTRRERKEYDFLGRLIPKEALADWMGRREKNYAVNEYLIDLLRKRGTFRYLTLGRDDNAPFSQTHLESRHLTEAGADLGKSRFQTMAGIDEIALLMLTRAVNEQRNEIPFVYPRYNWGRGADTVPAYSDEKISTSVSDAVLAAGGMLVRAPENADVVLTLNTNPDGRTYEANAVMNDGVQREGTMYFADLVADYVAKGYPVAVADIAFANGADNALMAELQRRGLLYKIQAYAGWNTPTNSSGFALGEGMLVRHMDGDSVDHLLTTRYLDDWAYQANIRNTIARQLTWLRGDGFYGSLGTKMDAVSMRSSRMMNRFIEENLPPIAEVDTVTVTFPWNRMFEADILPEEQGFANEYLAGRK